MAVYAPSLESMSARGAATGAACASAQADREDQGQPPVK